jgi:excisionase family DNA binding protein
MATTLERPPVVSPSEADLAALNDLDRALESVMAPSDPYHEPHARRAALIGPNGERVEIPAPIYDILHDVVHHMARGESIRVLPVNKELTTQQAADILNISRTFLVRLLDRGEIPFDRPNSHRRVLLNDVLAYRERRSARRRQAIQDLADQSQALGQY